MGYEGRPANLGADGARVETFVDNEDVTIGRPLHGRVELIGGIAEQAVDDVRLELLTRVAHSSGPRPHRTHVIASWSLGRKLMLLPGQLLTEPFSIEVPHHTPIHVEGCAVQVWLRTTLAIPAGSAMDEDAVQVHPDHDMAGVFAAMERLGFAFERCAVEHRPRWQGGHGYVQEFLFRRGACGADATALLVFDRSGDGLSVCLQRDHQADRSPPSAEQTGTEIFWHRVRLPSGGTEAAVEALASALL